MKTFCQIQNLSVAVSLTASGIVFSALPLRADYAVAGDLDVQQNIDYGTTDASPATSAVLQAYSASSKTARWDLTPGDGFFSWRDNGIGAERNKMKLTGDNCLFLYNNINDPNLTSEVTITLNPNIGSIDLEGTNSGIYSNGTAVLTLNSNGNMVFANRPFHFSGAAASTNSTSGALTVAGGVGVAGAMNVAGAVNANAISANTLTLNGQTLSNWILSSGFIKQTEVVAMGYQTASMVNSTITSKGYLTSAAATTDGFLKQANVDAKGYQTAAMVNSTITSKGYLTPAAATASGFLKQADVDAKGYQTVAMVDSTIALKGYLTPATATASGFLKQADVDAKGYQTVAMVDSAITSRGFLTSNDAAADGFLKQEDVDWMGYQTAMDVSATLDARNLVTASNIGAMLASAPQINLGNTTVQGDAVLNGRVIISQPQGDISMGIYGDN